MDIEEWDDENTEDNFEDDYSEYAEVVKIIPRAQIVSIGNVENIFGGYIKIVTVDGSYTNIGSFVPDVNGNLLGKFGKLVEHDGN